MIIINETLARRAFPGENPIGKRLGCCEGDPRGGPLHWQMEVVGVVGTVHARSLSESPEAEFYLPLAQANASWQRRHEMNLIVRTPMDPMTLLPALRHVIASIDPTIVTSKGTTFDAKMARATAAERFTAVLLTLLGATGLILAAVGIYGVIAYSVSQRTHEIGVRIALGASEGAVQAMVVRQGAMLALVGVVIGLAAALGLTRVLARLLFGVTARDPVTFVAVGALLALVALVASWIPARRATRIAPVEALRGA